MAWVGGSSRDDISVNTQSAIASIDAVTLASRIGCHSFIGVGSQAEYGINGALLSPNTACVSNTAFGASKFSAMSNCSFQCTHLGLRFAWARVFSVYGPYDRSSSLVTSTVNRLILSQPIAFTDATNLWDFCIHMMQQKHYILSRAVPLYLAFSILLAVSVVPYALI